MTGYVMFDFENFWTRRLGGAKTAPTSKLAGWVGVPDEVAGFVEPTLTLMEGDASTAKILIVSAPGAVGKSSFARHLSRAVKFAAIDLSQASPLGGNFFKGGVANAFGWNALSDAANGELGLIVDALDEAQLRATPQAYAAGLVDLASIAATEKALPTVLFGRTLAAEEAWLQLSEAGYDACLFQIDFFDEARAKIYISNKLPILAQRSASVKAAFENHPDAFRHLALEIRRRLTSLDAGAEARFAGYAPVLDAICAFTLESDALNPQARLADLEADSQIKLIRSVSEAILVREQGKLHAQLIESRPDAPRAEIATLYNAEEQLRRVASQLFGVAAPEPPAISDPALRDSYSEMIAQFMPQHPFLDGKSTGPANLVFAGYVMVWALTKGGMAELARKALRSRSTFISGVLFDLYVQWLDDSADKVLPLSDIGPLYEALKSQIATGQRASLEIAEDEGATSLVVNFEIIDRLDQDGGGRTYGPFSSTPDSALELQTPVTNVSIEAPIWVVLGDGTVQQIGAPSEITVKELTISAKQVLVYPSSTEQESERQTVYLSAEEADTQAVQTVVVKDVNFGVSWPGAKHHPWIAYATEPRAAPNPDIAFMRRRLRRVLTAFRSHSKGKLVRLAAKIDHLRMTKDARGARLVDQLVADHILTTFDAGKFYVLDPDRMGDVLGVDYQSLQQQHFTVRSDAYLERVLADS